MNNRKRLIFLSLLAFLGSLLPSSAFAITDPVSISLDKASSYTSVLESGDVLFVAKFTITYENCNSGDISGCPTETVTQAFLGNLVDDDGACTGSGSAHLQSVAPVTSTAPGLNGWTGGIFSLYFTAAQWIALSPGDCPESHSLEIEGNPGVFGTVPSAAKQVEIPKAKALLGPAILQRADELTTVWAVDLTQTSGTRLSLTGEDYFEGAIPNLRLMAAQIFAAGITSPVIIDQEFNKTYKTALESFGVGFPFTDNIRAQIVLGSSSFGIPETMVWFMIALLFIGGGIFYSIRATGDMRIGMMGGVLFMTIMPLIGIPMLEFVAISTVFATVALGYIFFLKGA